MQLIGASQDRLRYRVTTRDHQVIPRDVELFDREWKQREVLPELAAGERQVLDERRRDPVATNSGPILRRQKVDDGKQVGAGIEVEQLVQDALGATPCIEPIVDDGNSGRRTRVARGIS